MSDMSESDWLACIDPLAMLGFLAGRASDRKLRLFAVACCRRFWSPTLSAQVRGAIEVIEHYADKNATVADLFRARTEAWNAAEEAWSNGRLAEGDVARVAWAAASESDWASGAANAARMAAWTLAPTSGEGIDLGITQSGSIIGRGVESKKQCSCIRDICGAFVFRPATLDRSRLSRNVCCMAQAIYQDRTFDRFPMLADALEDAGCTDNEILQHARSEGTHVLGCWLIDLLLGEH